MPIAYWRRRDRNGGQGGMSSTTSGALLTGGEEFRPAGPGSRTNYPTNGAAPEPEFCAAAPAEAKRGGSLASACFDAYRENTPSARAGFLEAIAEEVLALGPALIVRAVAETGLAAARLEGERARTVGQEQLDIRTGRRMRFVQMTKSGPAESGCPSAGSPDW